LLQEPSGTAFLRLNSTVERCLLRSLQLAQGDAITAGGVGLLK